MMEVVIVDDGNRLTVYELVERVIPCMQKVFTFSLLLMADSMIQVQFTIFFENAYLMPGFHTEVEEKGLVSMISGIPLRSTF